jgi:hypothetical protein
MPRTEISPLEVEANPKSESVAKVPAEVDRSVARQVVRNGITLPTVFALGDSAPAKRKLSIRSRTRVKQNINYSPVNTIACGDRMSLLVQRKALDQMHESRTVLILGLC